MRNDFETGFSHEELSPDMMAQQEKNKSNNLDIPVQGENVDNGNKKNIDTRGTAENPNTRTQAKITEIHNAEAHANAEEHPTPDEILAQLEGGNMARVAHETPNSSLGGASTVEGANRESVHA